MILYAHFPRVFLWNVCSRLRYGCRACWLYSYVSVVLVLSSVAARVDFRRAGVDLYASCVKGQHGGVPYR